MLRQIAALRANLVLGGGKEGTPRGSPIGEASGYQPGFAQGQEIAKAEALAYLEAKAHRRSVKRWMQTVVVCLLAVVMLGADDSGARFNKIGHQMMCVCGCGQILLECNHVGCTDSNRMIGELREQLRGAGSDMAIMNWFSEKYGPTVLAAPIRGGFDKVAWITPLAAFVLATIGTGVLVVLWKRRTAKQAPATGGGFVAGDELRERIRRETEY